MLQCLLPQMVILKVRCESDDWSFINDHFYDFRIFALFSFFWNNIMMVHGVGSLWFDIWTLVITVFFGETSSYFFSILFFLSFWNSVLDFQSWLSEFFSLSSLFNCSVLFFLVYLFYSLRIFSLFAICSIEFQISSTYLMFKIRFLFFL